MSTTAKLVAAVVATGDKKTKRKVTQTDTLSAPAQPGQLYGVRDCLFDTEILDPRDGITQLDFFRNPTGARFTYANGPKVMRDTNMNQAGTMDYPRELSPLGFNFFIEEDAHELDRQAIRKGLFEFLYQDNRVYFRRPLIAFPDHRATPEFVEEYKRFLAALRTLQDVSLLTQEYNQPRQKAQLDDILAQHNALARFGFMNFVEFAIYPQEHSARQSLRLKPGESFGVRLLWDKTPDVKRPLRLTAVIEAVIWRLLP